MTTQGQPKVKLVWRVKSLFSLAACLSFTLISIFTALAQSGNSNDAIATVVSSSRAAIHLFELLIPTTIAGTALSVHVANDPKAAEFFMSLIKD